MFALNLVGYIRPFMPLRKMRLVLLVVRFLRFRVYTLVLRRYTLFARSRTAPVFSPVTAVVLMLELTLVLTMVRVSLLFRVLTAWSSAAAPLEFGESTRPSRNRLCLPRSVCRVLVLWLPLVKIDLPTLRTPHLLTRSLFDADPRSDQKHTGVCFLCTCKCVPSR